MAGKVIDITGIRFGTLVVLGYAGRVIRGSKDPCAWDVVCDCGKSLRVTKVELRTRSKYPCGCTTPNHRITHGLVSHPMYKTWSSMMTRCYSTSHHEYHRYGGRGIKVCERWHTVALFIEDVGTRPPGMTIDRFPDPGGNYSPDNFRWATMEQQQNNKSNTVFVEFRGITQSVSGWSKDTGIPACTLRARLKRWPIERALTLPLRPY